MSPKESTDIPSQEQQDNNSVPIDYDIALEEFETDRDFLNEIIEGFIEQGKSQIESIKNALNDNDNDVVARQAHSLKGASANLHAKGILKAVSILDKIARTDDVAGKKVALESIVRELEILEIYYKRNYC